MLDDDIGPQLLAEFLIRRLGRASGYCLILLKLNSTDLPLVRRLSR